MNKRQRKKIVKKMLIIYKRSLLLVPPKEFLDKKWRNIRFVSAGLPSIDPRK